VPLSPIPDADPDPALRSVIQAWVTFNERRRVNSHERRSPVEDSSQAEADREDTLEVDRSLAVGCTVAEVDWLLMEVRVSVHPVLGYSEYQPRAQQRIG
jgi:hypothetical protein